MSQTMVVSRGIPDEPDLTQASRLIKHALIGTTPDAIMGDQSATIELYASAEGLRRLLRNSSETSIEILVLLYGLDDGIALNQSAVGDRLGITRDNVNRIVLRTYGQMAYARQIDQLREVVEASGETFIEDLNLGWRAFRSLVLAGVSSIESLCQRSRKRVIAIVGIGPGALSEIEVRLAKRGLRLSDD